MDQEIKKSDNFENYIIILSNQNISTKNFGKICGKFVLQVQWGFSYCFYFCGKNT